MTAELIKGLDDFETVKGRIHARLLNSKYRDVYQYPRISVIDTIWKTFLVDVKGTDGCPAWVSITYDLLQSWGVGLEEVAAAADENDAGAFAICDFASIFGMPCAEPGLIAVTTDSKAYGAAAILDRTLQAELDARYPEGFWCIPSSVHEWLIMPMGGMGAIGSIGIEGLTAVIHEVNADAGIVRPEDRLGDVPYIIRDGRLARAA